MISSHIRAIVQLQKEQEKNTLDQVKRYALFPVIDEENYAFYQKQEISHWTSSELDFVADKKHYDSCSDNIRRIVDLILAFFLSGDGVISDNIVFRFLLECKTYEEKAMFISQLHIELVHAETYGLAAFTFKRSEEKMSELIESVQNTSCVQEKIKFMETWMLSDKPRYQRLIAAACAEGIFFCTLFAVVFWLRSKGLFPNLVFANELISVDESLHRDYDVFLALREPDFDPEIALQICLIALNIEELFCNVLLQVPEDDLNKEDLKVFARLVTDNLLCQFGLKPHFNVKNPFTWLDGISMQRKGNFYEVKIGNYKKKSLADVLDWRKRAGLKEKENIYADVNKIDF